MTSSYCWSDFDLKLKLQQAYQFPQMPTVSLGLFCLFYLIGMYTIQAATQHHLCQEIQLTHGDASMLGYCGLIPSLYKQEMTGKASLWCSLGSRCVGNQVIVIPVASVLMWLASRRVGNWENVPALHLIGAVVNPSGKTTRLLCAGRRIW